MLPKALLPRLLAFTWLSLCVAALVFGYVQRGVHDMPIAFTWFMVFLSSPLGIIPVAVAGMATSHVTAAFGLSYNVFLDLFPLWAAAVVAGYFQWFVALPWLIRKVLRWRSGI